MSEVATTETTSTEDDAPVEVSSESSSGGASSDASAGAPETSADASTNGSDSFDFSGWDGAEESLPDSYRPVYTNINERLNTGVNDLREGLRRDREIYQALLDGEDVAGKQAEELKTLRAELEGLQTNSSSWAEEKTGFESQISELSGKLNQLQDAEQAAVDEWARGFQQQHEQILSDEKVKADFVAMLEAGVDPEVGIELIQVPEAISNKALQYMSDGVPGSYALRLAKNEAQEAEIVEPRPAAQLTAGATPATVPNSSEKSITSNTFSIRDVRRLAATRAYKKRTG
jgi:hypothetical protein